MAIRGDMHSVHHHPCHWLSSAGWSELLGYLLLLIPQRQLNIVHWVWTGRRHELHRLYRRSGSHAEIPDTPGEYLSQMAYPAEDNMMSRVGLSLPDSCGSGIAAAECGHW
jgi:hypothetical protein